MSTSDTDLGQGVTAPGGLDVPSSVYVIKAPIPLKRVNSRTNKPDPFQYVSYVWFSPRRSRS